MTTSNTVKLTLDPNNPPPLTDEQRERLAALDAMPDEDIDYSDAPFRPDAVWLKAVDVPHGMKQISPRSSLEPKAPDLGGEG